MHLERIIPAEANDSSLVDHFARYLFAAQFVRKGGRVLDAACGVGYGSSILAKAGAGEVIGLDVSEDAVAYANTNYAETTCRFFKENIESASPEKYGSFDLIVSFETIEHVANPECALANLAALVAESGIALLSVPNDIGLDVDNPYHVTRFTTDGFEEFVKRHFRHTRIVTQDYSLASGITLNSANAQPSTGIGRLEVFGGKTYQISISGTELPAVFIAIASQEPLPDLEDLSLQVISAGGWVEERSVARQYQSDLLERIRSLEDENRSAWNETRRVIDAWEIQKNQLSDTQRYVSDLEKTHHKAVKDFDSESRKFTEELNRLTELLHMQQVQHAELRQYARDLEHVRDDWQRQRLELSRYVSELEEVRKDLTEVRSQLTNAQAELDQTTKNLRKTWSDLTNSQVEIARLKKLAQSRKHALKTLLGINNGNVSSSE